MIRAAALALAAALAAPAAARAETPRPPPAIEVAAAASLVLAEDSAGGKAERRAGYGLRAGLAIPGLVPRPWFVRAEAVWLHERWKDGTRAVNVTTGLDTVGLPLAAGYEWGGGGWWLSPYLAAGPSLVRTGLGYHVDDPLGGGASNRNVASWDVGAVYGAGARLAVAAGPALAFSLRLEALGLRRGVADDLALGGALGVLF